MHRSLIFHRSSGFFAVLGRAITQNAVCLLSCILFGDQEEEAEEVEDFPADWESGKARKNGR